MKGVDLGLSQDESSIVLMPHMAEPSSAFEFELVFESRRIFGCLMAKPLSAFEFMINYLS